MSTLASPRPSTQVSSSRRTSIESSTATSRSASATRPAAAPEAQRRNRAALRDYYGLKSAKKEEEAKPLPPEELEQESELDKAGFNADEYVKDVLARESLEGILKIESNFNQQKKQQHCLTSPGAHTEIRGLDGERKSLVYDNYSKLIAATDTIRRMRTSMDPLAPTTSTLSPAVAHIAETASRLSCALTERTEGVRKEAEASGRARSTSRGRKEEREGNEGERRKERERETVRWVLEAPGRMREMVGAGRRGDAEGEWERVKGFLEKWEGVGGVEEVRRECEDVLNSAEAG
ncbi:MAG: hypothetical protein M1822_004688 [Bathelium mastoideum]|nr:MAG: hypothetical protein M1822_004688 [Bathelium mastoideum]